MNFDRLWLRASLCVGFFFIATLGHAACAVPSGCYGPGLAADSLANTVVGGPYGNMVSYRFRAGHSGSLQQIHVYLIPNVTGYAAGTGGQIRVTVNPDDGTSAHNPSSTILTTYLLASPLTATPSINFPTFVFSVPPTLVEGQLYHIVFTNVDASPTTNYLSVDTLYQANPPTPAEPTISDIDSAELLARPGTAWAPRKGYTPILELDYLDGFKEGNGYMEVWVGAPQNVSGTSEVREMFTVSGAPETVVSASVRIARVNGSDPLTVRLEHGDGTLIEQGQISASSLPLTSPATYAWTTYTFSSARSLLVGQNYNLVFEAPSTSTYQLFPIRKGGAYHFQNTTYFPDGYAQFNPNGSWTGWTQWGVTNRTDGDLQFYFALGTSDPAPTISNVLAVSLSSNSATITWGTDQPSTSQAEYGTTTAYAGITGINANLATAHSQILTGLLASTVYHYRVQSSNVNGNEAISGDLTFTTLPQSLVPPAISGVAAGSITSGGGTITWLTDQASTSQVEYGKTTAYGSVTSLNNLLVTSHSQALTSLSSSTVYHYRVHSTNASGAQAVSGDFAFTTRSRYRWH